MPSNPTPPEGYEQDIAPEATAECGSEPSAEPRPAKKRHPLQGRAPEELSDQQLLDLAINGFASGGKLRFLLETAVTPSEDAQIGDLFLCQKLAFITGNDPERIDRLFRQSARMRAAWEKESYRNNIIVEAVRSTPKAYTGTRQRAERQRHVKTAELAAKGDDPDRYRLHDVGNAERFKRRHGENVKHNHTHKVWHVWTGKQWAEDNKEVVIDLAKEVADHVHEEAAIAQNSNDAIAICEWAKRTHNDKRIGAMVQLAKSDPTIARVSQEFDSDPFLFNTQNGTIELHTGTLIAHRKDDLITRISPVSYDRKMETPNWLKFLSDIFRDRESIIPFLQRAVGYSLTALTNEHCLFFLYGSGANGKSTFLNVISYIMGDYSWQSCADLLMMKKGNDNKEGIANLDGRRFVVANEVESGSRFSSVTLKILTSEDTINARRMYGHEFIFRPRHKLWIAGNHEPQIRDSDDAIWRRMRKIPFAVSIPPEQQDHNLTEKLLREAPGILHWAVEGCLMWQEEGLNPPAEVLSATAEYRSNMDTIAAFIAECCIVSDISSAKSGELYTSYKSWCDRNGEHYMSNTAFGNSLTDRGFERKQRPGGTRYRLGIGLVTSEEAPQKELHDWVP